MARANKVYMRIEGAKELDKFLESMGDQAANLIDNAVKAGGEIGLSKAKQYVARRTHGTGNLERNIVMQPVTRRAGHAGKKRRIVSGSVRITASRAGKAGDANNAYYGSFVELGTKYQDAKMFLRDAVDWNRKKIADAVTNAFKRLTGR
jgi:HK97 gp10 family phage protein